MMVKAFRMLALRHLTERPVRTATTMLGVALGCAVFVAIRTANVEVLRSFEMAVDSVAGRATLMVTAGDLGFDERVIIPIRAHPDVQSATPVISLGASIAEGPLQGKSLQILGLDLLEAADLKDFRVDAPAQKDQWLEDLLSPRALFIGAQLAEEWGVTRGDSLDLQVGTMRHELVVVGLVKSTAGVGAVWDRLAVMDIAVAQQAFGLLGRLDRIDIVVEGGRPVEEVAGELRASIPPGLTVSRPSSRNEQVERMIHAFQLNLATLSAVGLLVGLLLIYNTVSYSVVARRREIGILRAIGMSRSGVTALFIGEGAWMGLVGGCLGGGLGDWLEV